MEEEKMDFGKQLKNAISSGKMTFGQRQAIDSCESGKAKLLIFAANCPRGYIDSILSSHPDVPMHQTEMVNRELGAACAKPFAISTICVLDEGSSELLTLQPNVE